MCTHRRIEVVFGIVVKRTVKGQRRINVHIGMMHYL